MATVELNEERAARKRQLKHRASAINSTGWALVVAFLFALKADAHDHLALALLIGGIAAIALSREIRRFVADEYE